MPSEEEKEIYYSLRNITSILYRLYRKLIAFEALGKESSLEYEKTLKLIEFYTAIEDQYYAKLEKLVKEDEEIIERLYVNNMISTASSFPPDKQLSDPTYIIFHDVQEDDIIPMRMANKLFETSVMTREADDDTGKRVFSEYEPQKGTYFVEILDSLSKDSTCKEFRNELIKAKYKVAFINKRRCAKEISDDFLISAANEIVNAQEILTYARKMYGLSGKSIEAPSNARKLLLTMAYIRANMLQMGEVGMQALNTLLYVGEQAGDLVPRDGKKLLEGILSYEKEDKETFKYRGESLKRKF